jgi:diadenosine tetraphosphate (Ap4A) HIT family hydrolase
LAERVHSAVIERHFGDQLIGHISRDSTAIVAREKPIKPEPKEKHSKKRGRPKKGEERVKEPTRLQRQAAGMSLPEMKANLPSVCNVGTKRNSKGYKTSWIGYKLHIDASDGGIPISCLLTSASVHDSQVAIPLAEVTNLRVTNCYDLMDAAYDSPLIKQHSESLGHVPLIDENPRTKVRKAEIADEQKRCRKTGYKLAESVRYNERGTVERVNGRLKDEFNARMVRVRGHAKVMSVFWEFPDEHILFKSDYFFIVYDSYPVSDGHCLIISNTVKETYFDSSKDEQIALVDAIDKAKEIIEKEHSPDGYNIGINCGESAGQTVMHFHCHVIPKYKGDMDNPRGGVFGVIPRDAEILL